jgi:hypothetical protein
MNLVPSNNGRRFSSYQTRLKELNNELKEIWRDSDSKAPPLALRFGHKYSCELDRFSNASWSGSHFIDVHVEEHSFQCSKLNLRSTHIAEPVTESLAASCQAIATLLDEQCLTLEDA